MPLTFGHRYRISFTAEGPASAQLALFDVTGRIVAAIKNIRAVAGMNSIVWDGKDLRGKIVCAGNYLMELTVGGCHYTRRLLKAN
jgi:flagellar hook assembly protein FlgD